MMVFFSTMIACCGGDDHGNYTGKGANWIYLGKTITAETYYDKNSIKEEDQNIIRIWIKAIYSEDGKKEKFSFLKRINKAPFSADTLSYELVLFEIDCLNNKARMYTGQAYDDKGEILVSAPKSFGEWGNISPDSQIAALRNTVCSEGRIPDTKKPY